MENGNPAASVMPTGGDQGQPAAPIGDEQQVQQGADQGQQPTAEQQAQETEDQEWGKAADELFPGLKSTREKKDKQDEQTQSAEKSKEDQAVEDAAKAAKDGGDDEHANEDKGEEAEEFEDSAIRARLAARESAQHVETVRSDVRQQMFPNLPTELVDADGDPIRSIEDVMRLRDPDTGEAFTREAAGSWLQQAQAKFKDALATAESQISDIADVNVNLKDEADMINHEYGELLKAMPELRQQLWAQYEKTLVKDPKTGLITKAPVSLLQVYRMALEPYAELGRKAESDEAQKQADQQAQEEAQRRAQEQVQQKQQRRADRSDIYATGNKDDVQTAEDKEWANAADAVFGNMLKARK